MRHFFTFHNVSINTETREAIQGINYNTLHSIMFLLIQRTPGKTITQNTFTFHNVSINTQIRHWVEYGCAYFTFHNVSINTLSLAE